MALPTEASIAIATVAGAIAVKFIDLIIARSGGKTSEHAAVRDDLLKLIEAYERSQNQSTETISKLHAERQKYDAERLKAVKREIELLQLIAERDNRINALERELGGAIERIAALESTLRDT